MPRTAPRQTLAPDDIVGILGIVPTPATPDAGHWSCTASVDLDETARMTAMIRAAGISIFMTGGSFGEGASLLPEETEAYIDAIVSTLDRDGLVFAGVTTLNTRETIRRARRLVEIGADGLFLGRPMWMALDAPGIVRYYQDIAEALPGVPIVVYDNQFAFKGKIDTPTYAALSRIPEIIATKHIGGPSMSDDLAAAEGRMRVLPVDSQWAAFARKHPDEASACWTGNCADGPEPLVALAAAVAARDFDRADVICERMAWAQAPMFPGGKLENFVDYNVPIAHGRLQGSGLVRSGPPRPPYSIAPEGHWEGGRETGRRWASLREMF
ncbi:dihydrodipicolinate synthase family protein [Salinarimonas ramus]|uniref:Dihydrodipicolinate synthase/N-acetylneuraminate lyase n=1 Tax=Salinarimonas ramus TaxID=690164 RepID=A0A917V286_9HYPH|nr:dihydrodipicolinate synthase family protein [Salinarimonas ramus]GGK21792.1 hypothetical protein GCM10011322_05580 [Salinarimonas ramus]